MPNNKDIAMYDAFLISRIAHIMERSGLAMAGAMCGTFVAAALTRASPELLDSGGFIAAMVLSGIAGFYLGIDIPGRYPSQPIGRPKVDPVELLSATGTFLATVAALVSVYAFVFDEAPNHGLEILIGSWWLFGVGMQIGAGLIGRRRFAAEAAG